jgi:prevent-host-death family protein
MASFPKPLTQSPRSASVAEAKENFSALLRSVEHDRSEIIVRRRGVAVAKLIPFVESAPVSGYGWMKNSAHELGDIVGPTGEEWDAAGE